MDDEEYEGPSFNCVLSATVTLADMRIDKETDKRYTELDAHVLEESD